MYNFFPGRGWLIPVSTFKKAYFKENMSSPAGLKKSYSISRKSIDFGHFWLLSSTFKVDFLKVQEKIREIVGQFPGRGFKEHCVKFWASYLQKVAGATGSRFAKSVILASCNVMGRPFVACYARSIVYFHSSHW